MSLPIPTHHCLKANFLEIHFLKEVTSYTSNYLPASLLPIFTKHFNRCKILWSFWFFFITVCYWYLKPALPIVSTSTLVPLLLTNTNLTHCLKIEYPMLSWSLVIHTHTPTHTPSHTLTHTLTKDVIPFKLFRQKQQKSKNKFVPTNCKTNRRQFIFDWTLRKLKRTFECVYD